ncbi:MAG: alpha/beta hydrolase [Candidatus Ancaeobacter aquaticus]|nr:alpha/beta hydrolase [Candidatus Ancaeobacter aquaticus]
MEIEICSGAIISIPYNHHKIDAHFYNCATDKEHYQQPVVLRLHGTLGNLLDESEHYLPHILANHGYSSLTMNTLLANLGMFFGFGIFENTMVQIDAACEYLKKIGYKKIVVAGHGLGACMAIRYASTRQDNKAIVGVIGIGTPYSLPDTVKHRWEENQSNPSYADIYEKAKKVCFIETGKEPLHDKIFLVQRANGPTLLPKDTEVYTYKTWWSMVGPEAEGTEVYKHIGKVTVPTLLVRGLKDTIVCRHENEDLITVAKDSGHKDITRICFDADHMFNGKHHELGEAVVKWINEKYK